MGTIKTNIDLRLNKENFSESLAISNQKTSELHFYQHSPFLIFQRENGDDQDGNVIMDEYRSQAETSQIISQNHFQNLIG